MSDIQIGSDGYVTVNGTPVAYIDSTEYIWLNPANWRKATRNMSLAEEGALFELIRTHRPDQKGVAS